MTNVYAYDITMTIGDDIMASLKFENGKCHGGTQAKAMMRHSTPEKEKREIAAKENPHIDVSKSHLNKSLFGLRYEQICKKYDDRINELDSTTNRNKRKDRVTLQGITVVRPKDLKYDDISSFFLEVAKILRDEVGEKNFIGGHLHFDEVHEYINAETKEKEISREHGHFYVVPEYNGQLQAQKLYSRATIRRLNKKIDEMSKEKFGCAFMTGKKKRSRKTIDELKNESERLENERLKADNERLLQDNAKLNESLKNGLERLTEVNDEVKRQKDEFEAYRQSEQENMDIQRKKILDSDTYVLQRVYDFTRTIKYRDGSTVYDKIRENEQKYQSEQKERIAQQRKFERNFDNIQFKSNKDMQYGN